MSQRSKLELRLKLSAVIAAAGLGLATLSTATAYAQGECDYYREHIRWMYDIHCKGESGGGSSSHTGAAYSSFASAFNTNPAAVPTEPSPYGLETIVSAPYSNTGAAVPTFSIVKGFQKIGAGVSTGGNDTFFGNDIVNRQNSNTDRTDLVNTEPAKGYGTNVNLGTGFSLGHLGEVSPTLGVSARYNKITNTMGWGTGLSVSASKLVFGFGVSREQISNFLPPIYFYSFLVGVKLPYVDLEYSYLQNDGGYELAPIQILSATFSYRRVLLTLAVRDVEYTHIGELLQAHGAIQLQLFSHLSVGYLINYIPGTRSVACQIYL